MGPVWRQSSFERRGVFIQQKPRGSSPLQRCPGTSGTPSFCLPFVQTSQIEVALPSASNGQHFGKDGAVLVPFLPSAFPGTGGTQICDE